MNDDFDEEYRQDFDSLVSLVKDMVDYTKRDAERKANIENEFKKQYVSGYYEKSKAEDFYSLSDEPFLTTNLPIPTLKTEKPSDYKKHLDNLVSMLYRGLQVLDDPDSVVEFASGYKIQRQKTIPHIKFLKRLYEHAANTKYAHPHLRAVLDGEILKVLDFQEAEINENVSLIADMFEKKMVIDKYFIDSMDKHNKRMEAIEKGGQGDFVNLELEKDNLGETGLGWKTKDGELYKIDMDTKEKEDEDEEVEEDEDEETEDKDEDDDKITKDFKQRVAELDKKYKVKF